MSRITDAIILREKNSDFYYPSGLNTAPLSQNKILHPISYISSLYRLHFPYRFPYKVLHWIPLHAWWFRYLQCGIRPGVIIGEFPACGRWWSCRAKAFGPGWAKKAFAGGGSVWAHTASAGCSVAAANVILVFVTISYKRKYKWINPPSRSAPPRVKVPYRNIYG